MKKLLYFAAFAALSLTACSSTEDEIFDQSAAERLESYKQEYADVLTSDGGLWSMEYFSNDEEPGYVFVVKFDKDGSVAISANHKWIGGEFKQEVSLWKMIADNGPVLSFNSYNSLFHIFSDPANIEGPYAPKGDDGTTDVDETGFGHEGDYEFQVMNVSEDGSSVRLLGKKRMYDIYLHRLDASTDARQYLEDVAAVPSKFSSRFNDMTMTDEDGNLYRVYDLYTAIPSIYPLAGDAVMQTVSGNGIFTLDGFRFMEPLLVKKADDSEFEVTKLYFNENGTLSGQNVADLRSISPLENLIRQDLTWTIDAGSLTGKVKSMYDQANEAIVAALSEKDKLGAIDFAYASVTGVITSQLVTRLGSRICRDYIEYAVEYDEQGNVIPSDQFCFDFSGGNNTSLRYDEEIPAYKAFKDYLASGFVMTVNNQLIPDVITLTDKNDSSSSFNLKVK